MTKTFQNETLFKFSNFGHWYLFVIWNLIFGISTVHMPPAVTRDQPQCQDYMPFYQVQGGVNTNIDGIRGTSVQYLSISTSKRFPSVSEIIIFNGNSNSLTCCLP